MEKMLANRNLPATLPLSERIQANRAIGRRVGGIGGAVRFAGEKGFEIGDRLRSRGGGVVEEAGAAAAEGVGHEEEVEEDDGGEAEEEEEEGHDD